MIHQLRRFLPRQFVDWPGSYLVENDAEQRWSDCRVIDISTAGAGLELDDAPAAATEGQRIFVAVHLQAEIRHTRPAKEGRLRVGAQFVDLTDAERVYLASLTKVEARW
jgi:hypothetical protein